MKISKMDLDKVLAMAKRIKPEYARFVSRDKKLYLFFYKEPCLLGFEFGSPCNEEIDISIQAVGFLNTIQTISKSIVNIEVTFSPSAVVLQFVKTKASFLSLGSPEEFIPDIKSIFDIKGDKLDVIEDIAMTVQTIALQKESAIGWQCANDEAGLPFCAMTDRTALSVRWIDRPKGNPSDEIIIIPEIAADIISQLYSAYISNNKRENRVKSSDKKEVDFPHIYVDKRYVGYPFTDQIAFLVSTHYTSPGIDCHEVLKAAKDVSEVKFRVKGLDIIDAFKSVEGFTGRSIQVVPEQKSMRLIFDSSHFVNEKIVGVAVSKEAAGDKFPLSYLGLKALVSKFKKEDVIDVSFKYTFGKTKAIVFERDCGIDMLVCGTM